MTVRPAAWPVIVATGILLAACTAGGGPTPAPTPDGVTEVDLLALTIGDCLDTRDVTGVAAAVPVVDCASEHDSEAYAEIVLAEGDFPGADSVGDSAESGCVDAFAEFVGLAYDESTLDYAYYFPTEGSWAEGDRRILCLIADPETRVTGSLEGTAR